ncbi:MAG: TetR/AcrR family transcriptional regulator [Caldilineaceae bacterium]
MAKIVKTHDERRAEILDRAQQLFYRQGYDQTSIQEIIDVVGIAKGTFYHYFGSKIDLLDELIERILAQTIQSVTPVVEAADRDALTKFQQLFRTIESWKVENKEFFLGILHTFYREENMIFRQKVKAASIRAMIPLLTPVIRQGVDEGVFTTPDPDDIGEIIMTIVHTLAETAALLILTTARDQAVLPTIEHKAAVARRAIARLLGVAQDDLQIFDVTDLRRWFI